MKKIILKSFQCPGDIVMLTAAVRDLHQGYPNQFLTDIRTSADCLWDNNPLITRLNEKDADVQVLEMHYPLIHQSNQQSYHFIHGYVQYLEQQLDLKIPVTKFHGDIYLSEEEKQGKLQVEGTDLSENYWIIMAGGKYDFTTKWWNPESYQTVTDHFQGKIQFVQCGSDEHWHPPLNGVLDLVGKTDLREFVRLMYRAAGVLCPVTFAMHLAAAVESNPQQRKKRPCVVVAGGREPTHWEAYPHHQYMSTVGTLSCCAEGGCWKSRCQQVGDGDRKDLRDRCEQPVQIQDKLSIPRCMEMITADDVIRRIEWYLEEPVAKHTKSKPVSKGTLTSSQVAQKKIPRRFTLHLRGNVEELLQVGVVRKHLLRYYPDCSVDILPERRRDALAAINGKKRTEDKSSLTPSNHIRLPSQKPAEAVDPNWPQSLAVQWLLNELQLSPIDELLETEFVISEEAQRSVDAQLDRVDQKIILFERDLEEELQVKQALNSVSHQLLEQDCVIANLSWTNQPSKEATCSFSNSSDSLKLESIADVAALLQRVDVVVASNGPTLQLAQALKKKSFCIWRTQHPIAVMSPSVHVAHLLSAELNQNVSPYAENLYWSHYQTISYESLTETLLALLTNSLGGKLIDLKSLSINKEKTTTVNVNQTVAIATHLTNREQEESRDSFSDPPQVKDPKLYSMKFYHGLGDASHFARLIKMYTKRGYKIGVECTPDKEILFRAAGASIVDQAEHDHKWGYPPYPIHAGHGHEYRGSKLGWNISESPLPNIGDKAELWPEYCQTELDLFSLVPQAEKDFIANWLEELPKPITLLHTKGNTAQERKSLPDSITEQFYREYLDRSDGSVILLDWDDRVPRLDSYRCRHLSEMSGKCSTARLIALMEAANLMIGVDSGPLHLASLINIPCVGIWMPGHYPARYSLPDANQLNLVLTGDSAQWNKFHRIAWNIVEQAGTQWNAAWLAGRCSEMLEPARYLSATQRGADALLQDWVHTRCRGNRSDIRQVYNDRNRSFDVLLKESTARFNKPLIVETGTIRSEDDWAGAGFATYLLGNYVQQTGGQLHSVDLTPQHCQFARTWCKAYGNTVQIHQGDSIAYLKSFEQPIDVLYLDSLDTTEPGHAEHGLREAQVSLPKLHGQSLILFDDTPWVNGSFSGKGSHAIPWLLENGWEILYAGYQVLLKRRGT